MHFFSFCSVSYFDIIGILIVGILIYFKRKVDNDKRILNGDLKNKRVLVTGGSSGIGKALALKYSELGAEVIITGRNLETLKKVSNEGKNIKCLELDMEDPEFVEEWCEKHTKEIGILDIVIHNAGLSMRDMFLNTQVKLGERLLNVDFLSIFAMTKGLMQNMRTDGPGSVICGIGSLSGIHGSGVRSMYASAKGAMDAFFKCLDCETKPENIHSMVVHPGYIQTNVSQNALVGDGSKNFGKTDSNIKNGLPVEDCVEQIIESIILRKTEVWVAKGYGLKLLMYFGRLFPALIDFGLHKNLQLQKNALDEAE